METSVGTDKSYHTKQKIIDTVKGYGSRLLSFIRKRVRSDEDAEDILQDVWFQLAGAAEADEIEQMSGWLFHVARNKIIDKHRKKTTEPLENHTYQTEDGDFLVQDLLLQDPSNPETEYLREVFWQELIAALDELPEKQRQVFVWNELEDMTLQEIADKTGEKLKTIISRKGYAVKHLREKLETLYFELLNY